MSRKSFTQPLIESRKLVDEAKRSGHGRVEIRDANSPLLLRVTAQGARSFVARPRLGGRPIRLTYDGHATWQRYREARAWADEALDLCRQGIDPRSVIKDAAAAAERLKMETIADQFLERYAKQNRSWRESESILRCYVKPAWAGKLLTEVTREDVSALLEHVESRTSPYRRNGVLACVRKMFNWALLNYSELEVSPVVMGMAAKGRKPRTRYLAPEEIRLVWRTAERVGYPFGTLVQFLLATGQRRGEALNLRRDRYLDIEGEQLWTLPAEATKADREHWVPLSDLALQVLASCPRIAHPGDEAEWVFTTTGETPISGLSKMKRHFDQVLREIQIEDAEAASVPPPEMAPWRLHDLRRTAATNLEEALGFAPHEIGIYVLNHDAKAYKGVTATYTQGKHLLKRRRVQNTWARYLTLVLDKTAWNTVAKHLARHSGETDDAAELRAEEFQEAVRSGGGDWAAYLTRTAAC